MERKHVDWCFLCDAGVKNGCSEAVSSNVGAFKLVFLGHLLPVMVICHFIAKLKLPFTHWYKYLGPVCSHSVLWWLALNALLLLVPSSHGVTLSHVMLQKNTTLLSEWSSLCDGAYSCNFTTCSTQIPRHGSNVYCVHLPWCRSFAVTCSWNKMDLCNNKTFAALCMWRMMRSCRIVIPVETVGCNMDEYLSGNWIFP